MTWVAYGAYFENLDDANAYARKMRAIEDAEERESKIASAPYIYDDLHIENGDWLQYVSVSKFANTPYRIEFNYDNEEDWEYGVTYEFDTFKDAVEFCRTHVPIKTCVPAIQRAARLYGFVTR